MSERVYPIELPNAIVLTKTAGVTLSGHRVVAPQADGSLVYANSSDDAYTARPIFLSLNAALSGDAVRVIAYGEVTEPSWSWTPGDPIFLGVNGVLTQTPPTTGFVLQVAGAESPTLILFRPRVPLVVI